MSLEEMWARLTQHQPFADRRGYGSEWARMCEQRTEAAAAVASEAASAAWAAVAAGAAGRAAARTKAEAEAAEAAETAVAEALGWIERSEEEEK